MNEKHQNYEEYFRYLRLKETFGEHELILEECNTIAKDGNIAELNAIWRICEKHNAPFLVIKKLKRNKGVINIDLNLTFYEFNEDAQESIRKIFKEMSDKVFKEDPDIPLEEWGPSYGCGHCAGTSPEMSIDDLIEYFPKLVEIVFDKSNWEVREECRHMARSGEIQALGSILEEIKKKELLKGN